MGWSTATSCLQVRISRCRGLGQRRWCRVREGRPNGPGELWSWSTPDWSVILMVISRDPLSSISAELARFLGINDPPDRWICLIISSTADDGDLDFVSSRVPFSFPSSDLTLVSRP